MLRLGFAIALAVAACGCLRQPQRLTVAEIERVAWYVEDLSHGLERDPFELVREGASEGMRNIALWAMGNMEDTTVVAHPQQVEARRNRWPALADGLRRGAVVLTPDGLLRLRADAAEDDRRILPDLLRAENADRLGLTALLLSRGSLDARSERGRALVDALRRARLELATAAGATVVEPPEPEDEQPVRPDPGPRRRM